MEDSADPRINLVGRDDLAGLPQATVITGQIDPLRSESKVQTDQQAYPNNFSIRTGESRMRTPVAW